MKQYSVTTNDGHGHGDHIGAITVKADTPEAAVQAAYRQLASQGDYDTIVVSVDPIGAAQAVAVTGMTKLEVTQGDITDQPDIEAIVNAANDLLEPGGGVCGAIYRAAGVDQLDRCAKYLYGGEEGASCATGQAVHTPAFGLPNRFIIHAVGPIYPRQAPSMASTRELAEELRAAHEQQVEQAASLLASAYSQSLILASVLGCRSIAFPAISTGIYGYPPAHAALVAAEAVTKTVVEATPDIELVRFVCFDQDTEEQLRGALVVSAVDLLLPANNPDEQLTLPFPTD